MTCRKILEMTSAPCMVIKKVFLSVSIATISTFLQKGTLWRHNYGTSQPKFGQCELGLRVNQKQYQPPYSLVFYGSRQDSIIYILAKL